MKFNYQARTKTGQIQVGIVEAANKEAALALLQRYGLHVAFLEIAKEPFYAKKIRIFERITRRDIVLFTRQLAIMFQSKVSPLEAFQTLAGQTKNLDFRDKILKIAEELEGGAALSDALSLYPELFSPLYINMVKSGEAVGKLSEVLNNLADHLEREYHLYAKMIGAMIYPAFIFLVFGIVFWLITVAIVPEIVEVLEATEAELPLITKIAIALSDFLRGGGWILFLILIGLIIFVFQYRRTKTGKFFSDKYLLELPLINEFLKKLYLSRLAENLSTLIAGGLPISQALEITANVIGNEIYKEAILKTRDGVRRGEALSAILRGYPKIISPLFIQMTVVGEKTGQIEVSLRNLVDFYQKEVARSLDAFISLLEPILIISLGLMVGGLVGAVILPIYQMGVGIGVSP